MAKTSKIAVLKMLKKYNSTMKLKPINLKLF